MTILYYEDIVGKSAPSGTQSKTQPKLQLKPKITESDEISMNRVLEKQTKTKEYQKLMSQSIGTDKLHVISVVSNPCLFKKRYKLMREFIARLDNRENMVLYIVELAYGDQEFAINAKNCLRIRTKTPLWHKENMVNLGVKYLLPEDWKYMAWIDADIEFENHRWVEDTLRVLTQYDIMQPFSHCLDMNDDEDTMTAFSGFCYQYSKGREYSPIRGVNYWHPGYAWACTRQAFEKMGGLFEIGILGSADYNMAMSLIGKGDKCFGTKLNSTYKNEVLKYQARVKGFKIGHVGGVIRHYFHGSKINRKYSDRWQILYKYDFNPNEHLTTDRIGIIIPTEKCPTGLLDAIYKYFLERNEDE